MAQSTHDHLYTEIQHQLARGDHRAAAIGYEELGELGRARSLYEGLFDYLEAGRLAELQGDLMGALGLYLKLDTGVGLQRAEKVRLALMADLSDELPLALDLFEKRGYHLQAAELAESIGRLGQAADLYRQASGFKRAAQLLERLGRLREAGEAYEEALVGQPEDPESNLGLGRILQRFGRHREALRLLGHSARDARCAQESARRIAYAFFKLGFVESGRTALVRAGLPRNLDPEAFMRPFEDELAQQDNDDEEAVASTGALEGRYRVEKPMGGRRGAVFMGRDLLGGHAVVIRFFAGSEEDNAVYFDELERLQHANLRGLVRVLEINRPGGFVVSQWVEGRSLRSALTSDEPPTALQCRGYALQILEAVTGAHRAGVLHGALAASSVRLGLGGACIVDDWGMRHIEKRMATQTGGSESTFAYRAPELNIGRSADYRADLYSVAAILYRCLVGNAPLMGRSAEGLEDWPQPFTAFFTQALSPSPDDRFSSHDAFRKALQGLPWPQIARRRLQNEPAVDQAQSSATGPRFTTDHPPEPGQIVTAHDTLLERDVRMLRLPPAAQRPVQLLDRLTALAGPEVPVFQDILRHDAAAEAIILEVMQGQSIATLVRERATIEPTVVLAAAEPLLLALARAHSEGIGLGSVQPDTIIFDGVGLRAPIEQALLSQPNNIAHTIQADTEGFWRGLILALTSTPAPQADPPLIIPALRPRKHLLGRDVQPLIDQCPPTTGSLARHPEWFAEVRRAVDTCLARQAIFERLTHVLKDNLKLLAQLEQRRGLFGVD